MNELITKIENHLSSTRRSWAPACNYAYNAGHPCARNLVYHRLNWQEKPLPNTRLLLIFREGDLHEKAVLQLLAEAGIEMIETQRPFEIAQIQLRGKIDGRIKLDGMKLPTEIKSMNPNTWARINSVDDLRNSRQVYVRGYYTQMQMYLFGMEEKLGLFILKNKVTGELKFVPCEIDYEHAEKEWKKLELVNRHVAAKTYPERIEDRSICRQCDFRHLCLPDEESESVGLEDNETLVDMVARHEELRPLAEEYESLDESIKDDYFKPKGVGTYLVGGKYQIKVSEYERTQYNVPKELKEQYKEKIPTQKVNITSLK